MTVRTKKALFVASGGVLINIILALIKLFVGLKTNSLCIMLDSLNGFFDTVTGIVTAVAFVIAAAPKSAKYPYGRGRSEYVAGFIVSAAATAMGVMFLLDSVSRIAMPEPVWFGLESCILITVGVPVKLAMAVGYRLFNKKIGSKALTALSVDSFLDVGITSATVISFVISSRVNYAVDSVFGIAISIAVIICSVKMIADNLGILSGADACEDVRAAIIDLCRKNDSVTKILSMKLHDYGYRACVGTVKLEYKEGSTSEEKETAEKNLRESLKEETGADIDFI